MEVDWWYFATQKMSAHYYMQDTVTYHDGPVQVVEASWDLHTIDRKTV